MKKLLFLLIFVLPFLGAAQSENHLTFKNIPITGNISDFVSKMRNVDFTLVKKLDNATIMEGTFVNKKCNIYLLSTPKSNQVWKVAAFLPESDSWSSLKSDYFKFKEQFTAKYGKPSNDFEFFSKPYYEGDGYELQALRKNKCTYASYWELENGIISVSIGSSYIILGYEDAEGADIRKKEEGESIMNDI